jgi:hypothetical protein
MVLLWLVCAALSKPVQATPQDLLASQYEALLEIVLGMNSLEGLELPEPAAPAADPSTPDTLDQEGLLMAILGVESLEGLGTDFGPATEPEVQIAVVAGTTAPDAALLAAILGVETLEGLNIEMTVEAREGESVVAEAPQAVEPIHAPAAAQANPNAELLALVLGVSTLEGLTLG